ncbi:MAG TPA: hypothetical protein VEU09_09840 [Candidatus Binatia bacterium]|nr:hypothetical protein [Candidatus Binatia bacterium]
MRHLLVSALGITVLLGTPLLAQADQGKWWKPKEGGQRVEQRDRNGQGTQDRGGRGGRDDRSWGGRDNRGQGGPGWGGRGGRGQGGPAWGGRGSQGSITYRDHRTSGGVWWGGRGTWRGVPVRRDVIRIRDRRYGGGFFRARRIYSAPRFYGRFVYVRPVRYFIGADALIGGVGIHARIVRPHYIYGCNFCDEQFDSYDAYLNHVEHCPDRPRGCDISVSNWDDGADSNWDGPYSTDDGGYDGAYRGDDRGQNDGGYDPHVRAQDDNGYGDDNGYDDNNQDNGQDDGGYQHE